MNSKPFSKLRIVSITAFAAFACQYAVTGLAQEASVGDKAKSAEEKGQFPEGHRHHRGFKSGHHRKDALKKLDTNGDEKVDLNEFLANAEQRFNELDQDSDGYVTKEEASAKHREMREKHRKMREKHREMRKEHRKELKELREQGRAEAEE